MIKQEQFEGLAKFKTTSWAIWTNEFNRKGCTEGMHGQPKEFFNKNISILKNNVILLGLNQSGNPNKTKNEDIKEISSMRNFHTVGHKGDLCLKETIKKLDNIWGAYMTDLSDVVNSDAKKVIITDEDINLFIKKLTILSANNFHVVCFKKDKVFYPISKFFQNKGIKVKIETKEYEVKEFSVYLDRKYIRFYGVLHYSYVVNGYGNDRRHEFEHQMEYINNKIVEVPHFA